ncbi:MAG: hypothetical protein IJK23_14165 [Clostridia bacterium]|nr:hypothetical protein [Clostridia bacterium]
MNPLFKALGDIDGALIEEADAPPEKQKRFYLLPFTVSAAAAAAVAGLFLLNAQKTPQLPLTPQTAQPTAVVTITQTDPAPSAVTDAAKTAPTGTETSVLQTVTTAPPAREPTAPQTTTSPTTQPTTLPTTHPTTAPTTQPTTAPTTPTTQPTNTQTTHRTTTPTAAVTTTQLTTEHKEAPTTESTAVSTEEPTDFSTEAPTAAPTTTVPGTVSATEGPTSPDDTSGYILFINGEACFSSQEADINAFRAESYLGKVLLFASPEGDLNGEEEPLNEEPPHIKSAFPELIGADVYLLDPIGGNEVLQGTQPRYYLVITADQIMIFKHQ